MASALAARFPRDFVFGAGTSAFQIEGSPSTDGKTRSIWDTWSKGMGDEACKHRELWESDCELMRSLGLKTYRFSIAWTRVIEKHEIVGGGVIATVNLKGVAFYRRLMERLNSYGIEPMPTLYHWDLPQDLQDAVGGWLSPVMVRAFAAYARVCFEHLGHLARRWTTLNEPYVVAHHGHGVGGSPPGVIGREHLAAYHLLLAHGRAVQEFRASGKPGTIGIVLNCAWREPADPSSEDDCAAAALCLEQRFGWFTEPLRTGRYPECMRDSLAHAAADGGALDFSAEEAALVMNSVDFIGLNYYTTKRVKATPGGGFVEVPLTADSGASFNALGWAVEPSGLGRLLARASSAFPGFDLWVTENGYADSERTTGSGLAAAVDDGPRIDYMEAHLQQVADAIAAGVNVRGYVAWSLLDNLEWNFGYEPRFGIVHVDFAAPERTRTPKKSALWYQSLIEAHNATI
ncbi:beta-galactosidase [Acanthamoeba castellanii medusavirus]|uniref:Beta-galactosidase n=1 Tax=Acanthamoeba castellanii medusavirus J1 TaxID=3114988 RepID=A0A3T1CX20_9VIRU|nr:beta-galactosidase [Acanthamoeba castellanii medusavirus]BBI30359.1 beta-galactosidase [Acanthamoeba castellanii medusavirus J1]